MFQTTNQYILSYSHSIPVLVSLKPLFLRGPWGNHPVTQLNCQHHCKIAAPGRESPQTEKRKTTRCSVGIYPQNMALYGTVPPF